MRLASLLLTVLPGTLILRKIGLNSSRNCVGTMTNQHLAQLLARRSFIKVVFVSERKLRACFDVEGATTRYQVASLLSQKYPELVWSLPRPRKAWETEDRNLSIFDAASLALAYLEQTGVKQTLSRG